MYMCRSQYFFNMSDISISFKALDIIYNIHLWINTDRLTIHVQFSLVYIQATGHNLDMYITLSCPKSHVFGCRNLHSECDFLQYKCNFLQPTILPYSIRTWATCIWTTDCTAYQEISSASNSSVEYPTFSKSLQSSNSTNWISLPSWMQVADVAACKPVQTLQHTTGPYILNNAHYSCNYMYTCYWTRKLLLSNCYFLYRAFIIKNKSEKFSGLLYA